MGIREYLNERPAVTLSVAGTMVFLSLVFLAWWFWPHDSGDRQPMVYFYDLKTEKLFEMPADTECPYETDSGLVDGMPTGVRAHVYCCGPYGKGSEKIIGYLEIPTEAVPEDQWPPRFRPDPETEEGDFLVRRPDDDRWLDPNADAGGRTVLVEIMGEIKDKCSGKRLNYVTPAPK